MQKVVHDNFQKQSLLDMQICAKKLSVWHWTIRKKKWSVGQFAMKFPCMDKVFYSELFAKNKVPNCAIVSSSHCHLRQMVQTFLRSQTEHIRRGLSNHKKLRLLQVTRFFVDTFFLRPPVRSGLYAATCKKRGLQIDLLWFTLILLSSFVHILLLG